ncbi:MAG: restriction endonuclease [Nanopusillaceae archaeon]
MSNYRIGYYYERKVKKYLEDKGNYIAWRTPGSKSPIDIIAINKDTGEVILIQVKKTKYKTQDDIYRSEVKELEKFASMFKSDNIRVELWVFSNEGLSIYQINKNNKQ